MTNIMVDTTHANVATIVPLVMDVPGRYAAGYDTGSADIKWTAEDWAQFPGRVHIHIDQGGIGAPVYSANVIDIESGAYAPPAVTDWMNHSTAPRPTIYCNRSNVWASAMAALKSARFKGDVWLAFPGWSQTDGQPLPPLPVGCHYVAIQNVFAGTYDSSVILDQTWPDATPVPPVTNWTEEMVKELPLVQIGQTGEFVRRVQGLCVANGQPMAPFGIDGKFGNATKTAVENLQRAAGAHLIDGIVGQETWPILLGV